MAGSPWTMKRCVGVRGAVNGRWFVHDVGAGNGGRHPGARGDERWSEKGLEGNGGGGVIGGFFELSMLAHCARTFALWT